MKKLTFITCLVLLPLALQAQEDRYDQLTNPKLTSINKEAPRSTFTSYATKKMLSSTTGPNGAQPPIPQREMEVQLCGKLCRPSHRLHERAY